MFNMTHDSKYTEPWMKLVGQEASRRMASAPPFDGALYLDITWYEKRPSTHFFHRKEGDVLRPDAPLYPHSTSTHDFDKLRRAISDALTQSAVIADDKRVVLGNGWKGYADFEPFLECAAIRLGAMAHQTVGDHPQLRASPPPPVDGQTAL
jgi:Holliday junction resolvase RusA-like endonuclease